MIKIKPWVAGLLLFFAYCLVSEMDFQDELHREQIAKSNQVQTYAAR